jgi:hypothetical protein
MQSVCVASASSAEYRNVGPAGPGWSNPGLYTSRMTVIKIGCCRRLVRDEQFDLVGYTTSCTSQAPQQVWADIQHNSEVILRRIAEHARVFPLWSSRYFLQVGTLFRHGVLSPLKPEDIPARAVLSRHTKRKESICSDHLEYHSE